MGCWNEFKDDYLDYLKFRNNKAWAIAVDDAHNYKSDAHGGWVMVEAKSNQPNELLQSLKAGNFYGSTEEDQF